MYIDTHCHINFPEFRGETTAVLMRAKEVGVERFINVGIDNLSSKQSIDLARRYPEVYATVGLHPHSALDLSIEVLNDLATLAGHEKVAAIGEIGLDYYYLKRSSQFAHYPTREEQIVAFEKMLDLALEKKKPVVLHCREAEADLLAIIKGYSGSIKGVLHCFSSNSDFVGKVLDMGLMISFTGNITFKNAPEIQAAAAKVPLESIMIETDAPYLAPEPYRGKRNEPLYVVEIAKKIAELKNTPIAEIERVTAENAIQFFGIS